MLLSRNAFQYKAFESFAIWGRWWYQPIWKITLGCLLCHGVLKKTRSKPRMSDVADNSMPPEHPAFAVLLGMCFCGWLTACCPETKVPCSAEWMCVRCLENPVYIICIWLPCLELKSNTVVCWKATTLLFAEKQPVCLLKSNQLLLFAEKQPVTVVCWKATSCCCLLKS